MPKTADLVDIAKFIPNILIDLRYATDNNFTKQIVYKFHTCLLLKKAALALRDAQAEAQAMGLCLKVWDGFRPMEAQKKFWELVPDERYVCHPSKGGMHTRGTAVDLTLVTKEGKELFMPTGFDEFTERSHRNFMGASKEAIENRELLQRIMENHTFVGTPNEWWHFDLIGWQDCPPIEFHQSF
jgi:D-alanyl-D-alanine dipeptidase